MAKQKLQTALENEQNKGFAEPTIKHLLGVCDTDPEFAELVLQEYKTWAKCSDYIYQQARAIKSKDSNCVGVEDKTVYKWAEDYFRKDDKAEEETKVEAEKKAKAEAEAKKQAEEAKKKKAKKPQKKQTAPKELAPAEQKKELVVEVKPKTVRKKAEGVKPKAKKKKAEEVKDNALSLFDLM